MEGNSDKKGEESRKAGAGCLGLGILVLHKQDF
jgi:hypothetical protein